VAKDAVTHEIYAAQSVSVRISIPHDPPQAGEDGILLEIDGVAILMKRHNWQQFVNCVVDAHRKVETILDAPGRPLGRVLR
jgi:hypothetical protein